MSRPVGVVGPDVDDVDDVDDAGDVGTDVDPSAVLRLNRSGPGPELPPSTNNWLSNPRCWISTWFGA